MVMWRPIIHESSLPQGELELARDTVGRLGDQLQQKESEVKSLTNNVTKLEGELGVVSSENRKLNSQVQKYKEEVHC